MIKKLLLSIFIIASVIANAQVPVREEPRHKPVLQNKYIRLLDVWLPPGDTSLYHIHATPSLFVILSNTRTASQVMDGTWEVGDRSTAGHAWYRSFIQDTLVHRVANIDSVPFHVNDIEILSSFDTLSRKKAIPFPVLFENERAIAYQLKSTSFNKQVITGRGPIIAELVKGEVIFHDAKSNIETPMQPGKYLYIPAGTSFYFTPSGKDEIEMVVFEIK